MTSRALAVCPTANGTTFAANKPDRVLDVTPSSSTCPTTPPDGCQESDLYVSGYLPGLVDVWNQDGGGSPDEGEFASLHLQHDFLGMNPPEVVPDTFPYVQLSEVVHDLESNSLPLDYNVLRTDQSWPAGCSDHMSMAISDCMPTQITHTADPDEAETTTFTPDLHLFKAYVEGFCAASTGI